jgi:hypothetical protein
LHGRLIAREAYDWVLLVWEHCWFGGILPEANDVGRGAIDGGAFQCIWGHFVPDAFCPGGILREAFDWVLFDLEAFCSGDFCWEAFDRVLLTGGFLLGGF